ncbi:RagB/SusD family nutrient uptake outer membrane protein [Catalinimonas alkaloidigena]|uniref:RagB/SusD family nutrient uptake outer membrane protein n=1 Tax=Catalinimonas alkaloidigena TaxID=1075417 RepID=UPI00240672CA|nr:RagB/SusD family nutrient uptake outer membrane protein [Catalinimonas alkaloidigena]
MKNWRYVLFGLITTACADMLEVAPVSSVSGNTYYQTEQQILSAVNGAYGHLQSFYNTHDKINFWAMTEMRSDNTTYQFNESDRGEQQTEELDEFLITTDNYDVQRIWDVSYLGIQQSNIILNRIDGVSFENVTLKAQYGAEARFMRALYYFHLVRLYGRVPLVTREVNVPDEAFTKVRSSVEEIYAQIINDLENAIHSLPDTYDEQNLGRATRGAALTMLGEVYLSLGDYELAIESLEQVTQLQYSLLADYGDIFDPANKNHKESIFEIQFNATLEGEASEYAYRFVPFNSGTDIIGFTDLGRSRAGYNIPTEDILMAYEAGDKRKEASIAFYVSADNRQHDVALGDSIPYIKKFVHPFEERGRTNENWPVYRYAHVLLMLAEAYLEVGNVSTALAYLNPVRSRAGLSPLSEGMNTEELRDAIYHEQRVELAFENHRWFNLLRTGKAMAVMHAHGEVQKTKKSRLSDVSYHIQEYKLLYPIPQREVRLNNFEQNPGW